MNFFRFNAFLLIVLLGTIVNSYSQDKLLNIEDCFSSKYQVQGLRNVQWIPNTRKIAHARGKYLVRQDVYSGNEDTIAIADEINKLLALDSAKLNSFNSIQWKSESSFYFISEGKLIVFNYLENSYSIKRNIPKSVDALEIEPTTLQIAYVQNDNIYITFGSSAKKRITFDGGNGIVYGQAVHRNEFGINKGLFWSPEAKKLCFYKMDEKRVTEYPIYDLNKKPAGSNNIKYPFAGDSSHTVTVGVYNAETEETIYLQTENGTYDQYLTNISFSTDGQFIYLAWVNREQNHMELRKYNASNGVLVNVEYEEKHPKYVEPENPVSFIPNSENYLWQSEKTGFNHLYLHQPGKKPVAITSGDWEVTDLVGYSSDGNIIYFMATKESPLERHLYSVKLNDKEHKIKKITSGSGTHSVLYNLTDALFIDIFTSRKEPRKYICIKSDGSFVSELFRAKNPIEDFYLGEVKIDPVLVNGGVLYSRTFFPPDFDKKKKYPVIVYVYGGPHTQLITESWLAGANLWYHYMAQHGFIVYTVDGRGSAHRGLDFENATFRNLGTLELSDQLAGLRRIINLGFVDTNRIGVHGWSYGGFMTTTMMTKANNIYKVGVAGGPVIDWKMYEIMYTERYMDKPSENVEGYKKANLLNFAEKLEGKLLMIHGTDDDVVLWQHSLLFSKKCVENMNTNLDYFVYPGHKHNVIGPDRAHLYKKISEYFFEFL